MLLTRLRSLGVLRWIPNSPISRALFATLIAWLPVLLFTAHEGLAWGPKVQIPFLLDLVQYARFWIALPIAIAAGQYINQRLESILNAFVRTGIVSGDEILRIEKTISTVKAVKNSVLVEIALLGMTYLYTFFGLQRDLILGVTSWTQITSANPTPHAAADQWFLWVSMPILLFVWFRWFWWLGNWAYLLFRISRLKLRIVATHPDGVGGLAFINVAHRRLTSLVFAISSILCASIGEEMLVKKTALSNYEPELAVFFIVCLAGTLGPMLVFTPCLIRSKLKYWSWYGPFAGRYVQGFDDKWILNGNHEVKELLGNPDIQSLADLRHSYSGIAQMRTLLPNARTVTLFAAAYVVPVLPLLTSVISLRQIFSELYKLLVK